MKGWSEAKIITQFKKRNTPVYDLLDNIDRHFRTEDVWRVQTTIRGKVNAEFQGSYHDRRFKTPTWCVQLNPICIKPLAHYSWIAMCDTSIGRHKVLLFFRTRKCSRCVGWLAGIFSKKKNEPEIRCNETPIDEFWWLAKKVLATSKWFYFCCCCETPKNNLNVNGPGSGDCCATILGPRHADEQYYYYSWEAEESLVSAENRH